MNNFFDFLVLPLLLKYTYVPSIVDVATTLVGHLARDVREFAVVLSHYPLVMTNSLPWKITMLLMGEPSISMGHLYHGYVQ